MGSSLLLNSLSHDSSPKLTRRKQSAGMTRPVRQAVALKKRLREELQQQQQRTPCWQQVQGGSNLLEARAQGALVNKSSQPGLM